MTDRALAWYAARAARGAGRATRLALMWGLRRAVASRPVPQVPVPPAAREIDLPGRGTTYVVDIPGPSPDAPTLLLLHGIATSGGLTWFSVLEELAQRYRVVTFDQRWHARGIASETFVLDDCADDAAAVLDALGVPRAVVAGYSMGGAIAQVLWHRHPERVAGLVLCSVPARWQGNLGERAFYLLLGALNGRLLASARERVLAKRAGLGGVRSDATDLREWCLAELRNTSAWAVPIVLDELGRFDSRDWIAGIRVPVAVVITAGDRAIPPARQRELAALLPDAVVREAPGGHTSLAFDLDRWRPIFLDAVDTVAADA